MIIDPQVLARRLADGISNFYKNNMFDDSFLVNMYEGIGDVVNMLGETALRVDRGKALPTSLFYSKIPFYLLRVQNGLYDDTSSSWKSVYPTWSTMSLVDKINILDDLGKYEILQVRKDWETTDSKIVSLEVHPIINSILPSPYVQLTDYAVRFNKLYLFGNLARPSIDGPSEYKDIILKNVYYENSDLVGRWGRLIGLDRPPYYRNETYRDLLGQIINIYQNGPSLGNLRRLGDISGWEGTEVFDKSSPGDVGWMWNANTLTDFHFVVKFPPSLITSPDEQRFLEKVLDLVKPSYTQFKIMIPTTNLETLVFHETYKRYLTTKPRELAPHESFKRIASWAKTYTDVFAATFGGGAEQYHAKRATNVYTFVTNLRDLAPKFVYGGLQKVESLPNVAAGAHSMTETIVHETSVEDGVFYDMDCATYDSSNDQEAIDVFRYDIINEDATSGPAIKAPNVIGDVAAVTYTLSSGTLPSNWWL